MVISLQRGADLHMVQLIPLPLTVSCFSKIQIGFTFLVPAHLGSPGKRGVKRVSVLLTYLLTTATAQRGSYAEYAAPNQSVSDRVKEQERPHRTVALPGSSKTVTFAFRARCGPPAERGLSRFRRQFAAALRRAARRAEWRANCRPRADVAGR